MRVRIKQLVGDDDKWMVQKRKWFYLSWVEHDWYYAQEEALNQAKNLQSPAIIELIPIKKRSTTYIHYTLGE